MSIGMVVKLLFIFPFCILGQRHPEYFGNQDFKNFGLMHHRGNPKSLVRPYGVSYNEQNTERQNPYGITEEPFLDPYQFKDLYDEFDLLDDRITRSNKWEEYKALASQLRAKAAENPNHDWHDDLRKILEWSRKLEKTPRPDQQKPTDVRNVESRPEINPSPGMGAYWGESENEKKIPFKSRLPTPAPSVPRILTGNQIKDLALQQIHGLPKEDNKKQNNNSQPQYDDFGAPIKWVPVTSNETRDGLAKVTDPSSGRNREYIINGTIFVPVIDYSMERLGFTTTTTRAPVHTTDATLIRTVTRNLDMKNAQQNDWLVFETVMGGRDEESECYGEGCQARCKKPGCETSCSGDTCAAGCVASSCNSFCKGPGCFAMCVGEGCSARCEGMSCDARCRGEGCETSCRHFSCTFTTNGKSRVGGGIWLEHYPQYDQASKKANY